MNQSNLPARKATLTEVQEQFETWRKNRREKAIFGILWAALANLTEEYQQYIFPVPVIFSSFLFFPSL